MHSPDGFLVLMSHPLHEANCQGEPFSHVDTPSDVKASIVGRLIQPSPSAATELMHRATIRLSLPRASASLRACLCLTAADHECHELDQLLRRPSAEPFHCSTLSAIKRVDFMAAWLSWA
jgi:hypothetical protein